MRLLSTDASSDVDGPITKASQVFDPFDEAYLADPYGVLKGLREAEPVFFSTSIGSWVVTRYETIRDILMDPDQFSALIVSDPLKPLCGEAREIITNSPFKAENLLVNNDPPSHSHFRKVFGQPLRPARYRALDPFIRETVTTHLDRMTDQGSPADLVRSLTWEVPALVLFELIGVPREDVARVKKWSDSRLILTWGWPTDEEQVRLSKGAVDYFNYAVDLVQQKANHPTDDYTSDVIRLRNGDDSVVTLHQIAVNTLNLLFAGHETTSSGATNMFKSVLRDRDLWHRLSTGDEPLEPVVDEALRFDSPVLAWRRRVNRATELDGVQVPEGARLLRVFGSGNRDSEQFSEPESFCPARKNLRSHLAFGMGIHYCLGAALAKLEMEIMLELVVKRFPTLELVPDQQADYTPNTSFRGLKNLLVRW